MLQLDVNEVAACIQGLLIPRHIHTPTTTVVFMSVQKSRSIWMNYHCRRVHRGLLKWFPAHIHWSNHNTSVRNCQSLCKNTGLVAQIDYVLLASRQCGLNTVCACLQWIHCKGTESEHEHTSVFTPDWDRTYQLTSFVFIADIEISSLSDIGKDKNRETYPKWKCIFTQNIPGNSLLSDHIHTIGICFTWCKVSFCDSVVCSVHHSFSEIGENHQSEGIMKNLLQ